MRRLMQDGAKSICGGNEIHVKLDRFLVPGLTSGESQQQQSNIGNWGTTTTMAHKSCNLKFIFMRSLKIRLIF